jgi:ubiquitin conjugation factor E4 B
MMKDNYEYMDESSIDVSLKCVICSDPYINPCSTLCDHTFCRSCITKWIGENDRCPACRKKPLTIQGLKATNRIVFDMVDRLLVRCKACLQSNIQRGNFDEHFNKYCLKTYVSCSASDLKCP